MTRIDQAPAGSQTRMLDASQHTEELVDTHEHRRAGTLRTASAPRVNPLSEEMPMNGRSKHREFIESVVDRVPSDSFCRRS